MTEEFLQHIWKHKLFRQKTYLADTGEQIVVIHPGEQNINSGPDFCDTRIKIDNQVWAGNCEVHLNSQAWTAHNHNNNKAYDNVILHVVLKNNSSIKTSTQRIIPTIELDIDEKFERNFNMLLSGKFDILCAEKLPKVESVIMSQFLSRIAIERLESRINDIEKNLANNKNNWEESFYHSLARSFGFSVNAVPFELLAKSLPLSILAKHKNNIFQIEALLFGQSGLISEPIDDYSNSLFKEYAFLKKKYVLVPLEKHLWKFMRLRPYNFPTIRIAQFSSLVVNTSGLFSKILEVQSYDELQKLFIAKASEYWDNYFMFGRPSVYKPKALSNSSVQLLLINTIIPFIFAFGKLKDQPKYCERAIDLLENMKPEKNSIITQWEKFGLVAKNCLQSQALLQLRKIYCENKKCLDCLIGNSIIAN